MQEAKKRFRERFRLWMDEMEKRGIITSRRPAVSYTTYKHHGKWVTVKTPLVGEHKRFCLCYDCRHFAPGQLDNCCIAKAVFANCKKFGIVTPMWECPKFWLEPEKKEG